MKANTIGPGLRVLRLYTERPFTHTGSHLRGTLIGQFPNCERLHAHYPDGRARFAEIRYLVRNGVPHVVAARDGRPEALAIYLEVEELRVPGGSYAVVGKELLEVPLAIEISGVRLYRFATPWLALNQANHRRFETLLGERARRVELERIAIGNFITAAKAVEAMLPVEPRIEARIGRFAAMPVRVGSQTLLGFRAELATNVRWNTWVGLGKMVSKGFGLLEEAQ